jgi:hypothetical protein
VRCFGPNTLCFEAIFLRQSGIHSAGKGRGEHREENIAKKKSGAQALVKKKSRAQALLQKLCRPYFPENWI